MLLVLAGLVGSAGASAAQTLTIEDGGETGTVSGSVTSGTNWSLSGGTLTVTGTASIDDEVVYNALNSGGSSLLIVGNTGTFNVSVDDPLTGFGTGPADTDGYGLTIGSPGNAGDIVINSSIIVKGSITLYGDSIAINASLTAQQTSDISVLARGSITGGNSLVGLSTGFSTASYTVPGGDVLLAADTDATSGGRIEFTSGLSITTHGGDITLGGGNSSGSSYAVGTGSSTAEGIRLDGNLTLTSTGGDIALRGEGWSGSVADGTGAWGVGRNSGGASINAGTGTVEILGVSKQTNASSSALASAIHLGGSGTTIQSSSTNASAIVINGDARDSDGWEATGVRVSSSGSFNVYATGTGGGISITSRSGPRDSYSIHFDDPSRLLAASGPITITADDGTAGADLMVSSPNVLTLGSAPVSAVLSSSSDITLRAGTRGLGWPSSVSIIPSTDAVEMNTSGAVSIVSSTRDFDVSSITFGVAPSSLSVGDPTGNTGDVSISEATTIAGSVSLYGDQIRLNADLSTTGGGAAGDVVFRATGDILIGPSDEISTSGGDVVLWSNTDGGTINGGVFFDAESGVTTSGGHIWIGGSATAGGSTTWNGLTVGDGLAVSGRDLTTMSFETGSYSFNWEAGVFFDESTLNSGGGDIYVAGKHDSNVTHPRGAGIINYSGNNGILIDAGPGTVTLIGESTSTTADADYGFMAGLHPGSYTGDLVVRSSSTSPTAIRIEGTTLSSVGTDYGLMFEDQTRVVSLGSSGGAVELVGSTAGGPGLIVKGTSGKTGQLDALSAAGDITIDVGDDALRVDTYGDLTVGSIASDAEVPSSAADIEMVSNAPSSAKTVPVRTTGSLTVRPASGESFSSAFNPSFLSLTGVSGLTIGGAGNTAGITLGASTTVAGPITVYGGDVAIDAPVAATNDTIRITASGAVTDGASGYVTADGLELLGTGRAELDNTSNNVGTIASSALAPTFGPVVYVDADALRIGPISSSTGVISKDSISIATINGDLTVAGDVGTAAANASIRLYAGRDQPAGTTSGGDVKLDASASPAITVSNWGLLAYSGSEANTTDDAALTGGVSNYRYGVDKNTDVSTLSLTSGGRHGLLRELNTAPSFANSTPSLSGAATDNGFAFVTEVSEASTVYYVVVPGRTVTPTAAQVKAGLDATGTAALGAGQTSVSASPATGSVAVSGLQPGTTYQVFVIAEDALLAQSSVARLEVKTSISLPILVRHPLDNSSDGSSGLATDTLNSVAFASASVSGSGNLGRFVVSTDSWSGSTELLTTAPGGDVVNAGKAHALSQGWYFDWTLTPASTINLEGLSIDFSRGGTTATRGWFVRASTDNYATDLYSNESPVGSPFGLASAFIALNGFDDLTTPVTFRFYIYTDRTTRYMDFQNLTAYGSVVEGTGDLTVVASGGDALGSSWSYSGGVIKANQFTSSIDASVLEAYLASGALTVEAGSITIDADITSTSANALTFKSLGAITHGAGHDVVTAGGDVTYWSDSDGSGDDGPVMLLEGPSASDSTSVLTAGGDITIGGGAGATIAYAVGDSAGVWIRGTSRVDAGTGDIVIRGETTGAGLNTSVGVNIVGGSTSRARLGGADITIEGRKVASPTPVREIHGVQVIYATVAASGWLTLTGSGTTSSPTQTTAANGLKLRDYLQLSGDAGVVLTGENTGGLKTDGVYMAAFSDFSSSNGPVTITGTGTRFGVRMSQSNTAQPFTQVSAHNGDVRLVGVADSAGVLLADNVKAVATGTGEVHIEGDGRATGRGVYFWVDNGTTPISRPEVTAAGDSITVIGVTTSNTQPGIDIQLGTKIHSAISTHLLFRADALAYADSAIYTQGTITLEPHGASFSAPFTWSTPSNAWAETPVGLAIGKAGNTADLTIAQGLSVDGPITLHAGAVALDAPVTATNDTIRITASGAVTDGASGYVTANALAFEGSGSAVLDHESNDVDALVAAGSPFFGALTFVDADELAIGGTVGSVSGITSSGEVSIATLNGDLTLAGDVGTSSNSADALRLFAGRDVAALTTTGGDIKVAPSVTPAITIGATGIAKFYSGSEAASTGLLGLAGGAGSSARYQVDAATDVSTLGLSSGGRYALYRGDNPASVPNSTFGVPPSNVVADGADAATLTITVNNAFGNPVSGASVFFATDFGTLSAGPWATDANGQASAELTSTLSGAANVTGYLGTDTTGTSIGSATVSFVAGAATQLVFTAEPSASTVAGAAFAQQPVVEIRDANGNLVTSATNEVTLALTTGTGTLRGTTTVAAVNGVATFSDLSIDLVGSDKVLTASSGSLTTATTSAFAITVGAVVASASTVSAPAGDVVADGTTPVQVTIVANDTNGNPVPGTSVFFTTTLGTLSTPAALMAGASTDPLAVASPWTTDANGRVTAELRSTSAGSATVRGYLGTDTTGTSIGSATVSFVAGAATQLVFTAEPSASTVAGTAFAQQPVVEIRDANGNVVTTATDSVTLALTTGTGTLSGTTTVAAVAGVATFSGLSIGLAGADKVLTASSGSLTTATTSAFTIVAGTPDAGTSEFAVSPTSLVADGTSAATLELTVRDAQGNAVSGAAVFFATDLGALSEGPWTTDGNGQASAELTSTLSGTATVIGYLGTDATGTEVGSGSVVFEPGYVDAVRSSVSASDSVVAADGEAMVTIEAVLRDANGNVVPRTEVELLQGEGRSTIEDATRRANARGEVSFVVRSAVADTVTYTVQVLDGARPGFTLESSATVIFTPVARLEFMQEVSDETPALGDTVTVRYEVRNTGSGPSEEVVLQSGVLLPRLEIVEVIELSPESALDMAAGTWTIASVPAGQSVVLEFKAVARGGGQ